MEILYQFLVTKKQQIGLFWFFVRKCIKKYSLSHGRSMSYITIDENKCKSCYLCMDVCPHKLIKKSDKTGKTGECIVEFQDKESKCIGCAQCALVCPDLAIVEVYK